jgi:hypothetical protein
MQPIHNEHIARSVARNLLNIIGMDSDERYKHTFINRVEPVNWAVRRWYGVDERSEDSYELMLSAQDVGTLENALVAWAARERLDGDNCYHHHRLGPIEAYKNVLLGELPDTLLINLDRSQYNFELNRFDVITNPVSVPLTLHFSDLEVLKEPSMVQYNLMAFVVGKLRRRTLDDQYIYWHAYIRIPRSDQWHYIEQNPISECVQYPTLSSLSTESVRDLLTGDTPGGEFCMKAWYQRCDAAVRATTPSVAAWEESWRDDLAYSVNMEQGGSMPASDVAIGIPIAVTIE